MENTLPCLKRFSLHAFATVRHDAGDFKHSQTGKIYYIYVHQATIPKNAI
jgi:hypothetical protein